MSSDVEIVNWALILIGENTITSLSPPDPNTKAARTAAAVYAQVRDNLLGAYSWVFAAARTQLPALASAPAYGYQYQYELPSDALRIIQVDDVYLGVDLSNYRTGSTDDYAIEGRNILTDIGAPLKLRYCRQVTDPSLFHPSFASLLAAELGLTINEALTQSPAKDEKIDAARKVAFNRAVQSNAFELPPSELADDSWILSRR